MKPVVDEIQSSPRKRLDPTLPLLFVIGFLLAAVLFTKTGTDKDDPSIHSGRLSYLELQEAPDRDRVRTSRSRTMFEDG